MPDSFTPHLSKLPKAQRQLWPLLAPLRALGLVLHGGTAIALRLGHRASVDFDFFTNRPLDRKALLATFPSFASAIIIQDEPNTWTGIV
ncbi:MAG: nucleotidyl transferase AbiEii/AbiGii toxin family protein, partial [Opitutaceae bacterium]